MDKLDNKSKEFINHVLDKLDSEEEYLYDLVEDIIDDFRIFIDATPKEELIEKLKSKMIAGAKEHGEPKEAFEDIQKEIEFEFQDLLVWTMMRNKSYESD